MSAVLIENAFRKPGVPLAPEQMELRIRTLNQIELEPENFNMSDWEQKYLVNNICHTVRCIAGWAQFLVRGKVYENGAINIPTVDIDAIVLLGLTADEYHPTGIGEDDDIFYCETAEALRRMRRLVEHPQ